MSDWNGMKHGRLPKRGLLQLVCVIVGWIIMGMLLPLPKLYAHPHIFIVQRLNIIFDENGMAGIRVRWKFDDMFAGMLAEDADVNRNGTFEADEVQAVKENAFVFIAEFNYFTFVKIDGKPFDVKFIRDFKAVLQNGSVIYEFLIPCHVTATRRYKKVTVATYDPTYYTAIFFSAQQPATLTNAGEFEIKTAVREDPDTRIYYDMVHPWALFLEFRTK